MGIRKRVAGLWVVALASLGAALACSAPSLPGALTPTPTFYEIFPPGTEPSTGTPAADTAGVVREIQTFYPFAKGAQWVYQADITVEGAQGAEQHWAGQLTATVTDAKIDSGFPVYRVEWVGYPDFAWPDLNTEYYVVRAAGIYRGDSAEQAARLAQSEVFTQTAFLAWPPKDGKVWGDPDLVVTNSTLNVWRLTLAPSLSVPAGTFQDCYQAAMFTNPDTTFRWFCPGEGLTRFEYHHHGSVNDQVWELESFKPGT